MRGLRLRRWAALMCLCTICAATLFALARNHGRAAVLLLQFQGQPVPASLWAFRPRQVDTEALRDAPVPTARLYLPSESPGARGLVFVHGVHYQGIDEPRQVALVGALAAAGFVVLAPQLDDLTEYRFTDRSVEQIGASAAYLADRLGVPAVGVMGISYSGGLALLAAASGPHRDRISSVVAVGAHHDMGRVMKFYATGRTEGPGAEPHEASPHPYGAGVMVHNHLGRFFSNTDLELGRELVRLVLTDRWRQARDGARRLSPSGRRVIDALLTSQAHERLGPSLLELVRDDRARFARYSPAGQLGDVAGPVFLLHGTDDPIVPATETRWLAHELGERAEAVLVTDLLRHAELSSDPTIGEQWALVRFMAQVLSSLER